MRRTDGRFDIDPGVKPGWGNHEIAAVKGLLYGRFGEEATIPKNDATW